MREAACWRLQKNNITPEGICQSLALAPPAILACWPVRDRLVLVQRKIIGCPRNVGVDKRRGNLQTDDHTWYLYCSACGLEEGRGSLPFPACSSFSFIFFWRKNMMHKPWSVRGIHTTLFRRSVVIASYSGQKSKILLLVRVASASKVCVVHDEMWLKDNKDAKQTPRAIGRIDASVPRGMQPLAIAGDAQRAAGQTVTPRRMA